MARWILVCPNCGFRFAHSNVEPTAIQESQRDPFHVVAKPELSDGETIVCPNCKVESVYQAFELVYEAERAGPTKMG
jgi:DNA-directed RNA polymerase subunit RPC12/RpoP